LSGAEELQKNKNAELSLSWDDDGVSTNDSNNNVNHLNDDKTLKSQTIVIPNQSQSSQTPTTESTPSTTLQSTLKESQTSTKSPLPNKETTLSADCSLPQTKSITPKLDIIGQTTHSPNTVSSTTQEQNITVPITNQSTTKDEVPPQSPGNGDDDVFGWQ
jgi:hypothetical protein